MNGMKCLRGSLLLFSMAIIIVGGKVVAKAELFDVCKPVKAVPPACEPVKTIPVCEHVKPVPPPCKPVIKIPVCEHVKPIPVPCKPIKVCKPVKTCDPVKACDQGEEKYPVAAALHNIAYVLTSPLRIALTPHYETYEVEYSNTEVEKTKPASTPTPASTPQPNAPLPPAPTTDKT